MLISKSDISANDVVSIKLTNGDELIAKVVELDQYGVVTITKPMLMQLMQDPRSGQPAITMAPFWILGSAADSKYKINSHAIICMVVSGPDAKAGYVKQTTGLLMPGSPDPNGSLSGLVI